MAEIEQTALSRVKRGVSKSKKLSTRVDLTPMVDLGFLLITFFIFTTSIAKPTSMYLVMPDDKDVSKPMLTAAGKTLSVVLEKDNRIFYYDGFFNGTMKETSFNPGLRQLIITRKQKVKNELVVLIKVTNAATYKQVVDCLDEMLINDVRRYMILDATKAETDAVINK